MIGIRPYKIEDREAVTGIPAISALVCKMV